MRIHIDNIYIYICPHLLHISDTIHVHAHIHMCTPICLAADPLKSQTITVWTLDVSTRHHAPHTCPCECVFAEAFGRAIRPETTAPVQHSLFRARECAVLRFWWYRGSGATEGCDGTPPPSLYAITVVISGGLTE